MPLWSRINHADFYGSEAELDLEDNVPGGKQGFCLWHPAWEWYIYIYTMNVPGFRFQHLKFLNNEIS